MIIISRGVISRDLYNSMSMIIKSNGKNWCRTRLRPIYFCKNYEIKDSFHRQELYLLVILQNKLWIFLPKCHWFYIQNHRKSTMFHPYRSTEPHKIRKNLLFFTYSHLQIWIDSFSLIQILQFQSQCFHFTQIVMSNLWHDNCALFQKSQFNLTDFNPTFFDVPKMKRVNNVWSFSIFRKKLNSNSSNQIQLFFNLKKIQNLIWKTKFTFFYLQKIPNFFCQNRLSP